MKFILTFKTPDALDKDIVESLPEAQDLDADAQAELWYKVKATTEKFVEYNEYVSIEFDTETGSAKVIPLK